MDHLSVNLKQDETKVFACMDCLINLELSPSQNWCWFSLEFCQDWPKMFFQKIKSDILVEIVQGFCNGWSGVNTPLLSTTAPAVLKRKKNATFWHNEQRMCLQFRYVREQGGPSETTVNISINHFLLPFFVFNYFSMWKLKFLWLPFIILSSKISILRSGRDLICNIFTS